jgi:hypothetical protein
METGLDVNADKTKYNDMSRDLNAGKNHNIRKQAINRSRMWNRSDIMGGGGEKKNKIYIHEKNKSWLK